MARPDTPQKREKKKKRPLTTKEKKLIKGVAEGKPKRTAAIEAGYSERSAGPIATETLKKPNVQEALKDLMDRMGLGDEQLLLKVKEGLAATRTISAIAGNEANGGVDVPDYHAQHKFLDTALKIRGSYAAQKLAHEGEVGLLGVVVLPETQEEQDADGDPATS